MVDVGLLHAFDRGEATSAASVARFAQVAEQAGVESLWIGEHLAIAADYEPRYPYSSDGRMRLAPETVLPDPFEWLSFVAACTTKVRLATGAIILPLHHPVMLAKRVATLDALSGGRVLLGVGVGWQYEEYAALGIPYSERGARADEAIDALRTLWREQEATHHGRFTSFDRLQSDPKPTHGTVPIIVCGSSRAAARRAGARGDGWYPSGDLAPDDVARMRETVRSEASAHGRDPEAVEITVRPSMGRPGALFDVERVQRYVDAGATRVVISAQEVEGRGIEPVRRLLGEYMDRVVGELT